MHATSALHLYTIGHSNQTAEEFVALLRAHRIEVLVDVRSAPYSRWAPHFSKESLSRYVKFNGMQYLYLGKELGGRPDPEARPDLYDDDGHALYHLMAREPAFVAGIERLVEGIPRNRVAIMCSEEDPTHCHRRLLVGKVMTDTKGIELKHVRRDGRLTAEFAVELPGSGCAIQRDLFSSPTARQEAPHWRSSQPVLRKGR